METPLASLALPHWQPDFFPSQKVPFKSLSMPKIYHFISDFLLSLSFELNQRRLHPFSLHGYSALCLPLPLAGCSSGLKLLFWAVLAKNVSPQMLAFYTLT